MRKVLCQLLTQELYDICPTNKRCFNPYYLTIVINRVSVVVKETFVISDDSPVWGTKGGIYADK